MKHSIFPVSFLIITLFFACGTHTAEVGESGAEEISAAGPTIHLEGMYATTTRLPLSEFAMENIFDGDTATYWSTPAGSGPDEGFVIYFPSETYIKEIDLEQAGSNDLASITEVSVYADGQRVGNFNPALPLTIDKSLTSLFVKIGSTNRSTSEYLTTEDQKDLSSISFDSNSSVGIAEITFAGESGALKVRPPSSVQGMTIASSVLHPAQAYDATQLFDSRREFVWAEGKTGAGENEKLTFRFAENQKISSIKLWNGYQRSDKHFRSNGRIKMFEFGPKNGDTFSYKLKDTMDPQIVKLKEPMEGKEFELKILEVYRGSMYEDLVVSELLFFNDAGPFVIRNDSADDAVQTLLATSKGSLLEQYLDRRLKNVIEHPDYFSDRSLILRSNRTFVLYDHTTSSEGSREQNKEVVADGNWEIVEQRDGYAKIRVFGKLFNLSETLEYYKGNTKKEFVTIFQDNLHITPSEIKGEKHVEAFYSKSSED